MGTRLLDWIKVSIAIVFALLAVVYAIAWALFPILAVIALIYLLWWA